VYPCEDADRQLELLPSECAICGDSVLLFDDLAPFEKLAIVWLGLGMCARHWSNFAQKEALSAGPTLLLEQDRFTLSD
jgi:hypothetical protein